MSCAVVVCGHNHEPYQMPVSSVLYVLLSGLDRRNINISLSPYHARAVLRSAVDTGLVREREQILPVHR